MFSKPGYFSLIAIAATAIFLSSFFIAGSSIVEDDLGREVALSSIPNRIVTTVPSLTETVLDLGLEEKLVGTSSLTRYLNYVPRFRETAEKKESVGDYNIPLEKVVSLNPDLVIVDGFAQRDLVTQLEDLNIPVYAANPKTVRAIKEVVLEIGQLTGKLGRAKRIVGEMTYKEIKLDQALDDEEERKKVFYVIDKTIYTTGSDTFLSKILEKAGLINVFGTISGFKQVSDEEIVNKNPELIIVAADASINSEYISSRPGFSCISAVKNGDVLVLTQQLTSMISQPGTKIVDGAIELYETVYDNKVDTSR